MWEKIKEFFKKIEKFEEREIEMWKEVLRNKSTYRYDNYVTNHYKELWEKQMEKSKEIEKIKELFKKIEEFEEREENEMANENLKKQIKKINRRIRTIEKLLEKHNTKTGDRMQEVEELCERIRKEATKAIKNGNKLKVEITEY